MYSRGSKKAGRLAALALLVAIMTAPSAPALAGEDSFVRIEKPSQARDAAGGSAVIRVSGTGREPSGYPAAQARLMARRAAVVDGYRKLAEMRNKVSGSITGKTYYKSVNEFITGASVVETRYYYNGHVEVDMELPVDVGAEGHDTGYETLRHTLSENGVAVVEVEADRRRITREEWKELFMKRRAEGTEREGADAPGPQ